MNARRRDARVACRADWFRLPAELRRAISGNYRLDPLAHIEAMTEAAEWYEGHAS